MTRNRQFAGVFGAVYVLVGLLGFAVTSGVGFAASRGKDLIVFELNPLHNLVHIAVGGLLIAGAAAGHQASRAINSVVGVTYAVVAVLGLLLAGSSADILALNGFDNALHIATAVVALAVAFGADRDALQTA